MRDSCRVTREQEKKSGPVTLRARSASVPGKLSQTAEWLDWDVEIGYHANRRSLVRGFSETDLRVLITDAAGFEPSHMAGRFVLHSRLGTEAWRIVVEPDHEDRKLVVVTAWRA